MKPRKNKINRIRTFALSLVFIGVIIMYAGIFFKSHPIVMTLFMILGLLAVIGSTVTYAWIGLISTKAAQVECPNCGGLTKIIGRVDMCGHCQEPLTMDPSLEGKEFDEMYNKPSQNK